MAELLKGGPAAKALTEKLSARAMALREKGVVPTLAIVRVGERPDDLAYERGAVSRAAKAGVEVRKYILEENYVSEELFDTIRQINEDPSVHGCLVFRPLRKKEDEDRVCAMLDPAKDVDGITRGSLATVFTGRGEGFAPCTAQAVMELLAFYGFVLTGKRVTVIGRSLVIGKPVSMMLQAGNATVTMCHTRTLDLAAECRRADILVAAAGKAGVVRGDFISPGQVVVDVGINVDEKGNLCGDVAFEEACEKASAITPVPGGVGTMTSTVLCMHVIEAAEKTLR
jgi:methylenetetrahydrofolate dehydrogenase (NADP+)/methenyltetrahydrofolate cyclohydrolase